MMRFIGELIYDQFGITIPYIRVIDVIQILLLTILVYSLIAWMRTTKAWNLFKGLVVLLFFYVIAVILDMSVIVWMVNHFLSVMILAIIIIFHPEIRQALERLGSNLSTREGGILKTLVPWFFGTEVEESGFDERTVMEIVEAAFSMSKVKTGALMVIQNKDEVERYVLRWGTNVDALVGSELLINIFEKNTPLHDGAVIIAGNRIVAAKCFLPLKESGLKASLGTRHHAAAGISDITDSITVVVSEETGSVSVAIMGRIRRVSSREELRDILTEICPKSEHQEHRMGNWIRTKREAR